MLACSRNVLPDDLQSLQYPLYGTPKLDGIRMLIVKRNDISMAVSRKLLPIPNAIIQDWVSTNNLPEGLDGEIIIPGKSFNEIQSKVMTSYTAPFDFRYMVFDCWDEENLSYLARMQVLDLYLAHANVKYLSPYYLQNKTDVELYEDMAINHGYEGIILRSGDGPYKQGRSTWNEGYMLKMKRFEDCEGTIIGFLPKMKNNNPQQTDETGYAKRSKHKANLSPSETMGKMIVESEGKRVTIGTGWDAAFAKQCWDHPEDFIGKTITYKKQTYGEKDNPRIASFKGMRYD